MHPRWSILGAATVANNLPPINPSTEHNCFVCASALLCFSVFHLLVAPTIQLYSSPIIKWFNWWLGDRNDLFHFTLIIIFVSGVLKGMLRTESQAKETNILGGRMSIYLWVYQAMSKDLSTLTATVLCAEQRSLCKGFKFEHLSASVISHLLLGVFSPRFSFRKQRRALDSHFTTFYCFIEPQEHNIFFVDITLQNFDK